MSSLCELRASVVNPSCLSGEISSLDLELTEMYVPGSTSSRGGRGAVKTCNNDDLDGIRKTENCDNLPKDRFQ